jgi:hypothetical protein
MGGIRVQIRGFSISLAQDLYHRPRVQRNGPRRLTAKDHCRSDLGPADQTCLNCVFDFLKPVLGLFTRQLGISKTSN